MPIIYEGQLDSYYNPPKFGTGFTKKKRLAFNPLYNGLAFRDFGNNVVIGNGVSNVTIGDGVKTKKQEFIAQQKQQEAVDKIIKNTDKKNVRTKEDIIGIVHGSGFKMC